MSEKVTGYTLLIIGLIVIVFAAVSAYQVFTGTVQPLPVINASGIALDMASLAPGQKGSMELFSAKDLNLVSNLTVHYLLMTFLVTVGSKIAGLGIQLLRTIEVKVNQK